METFMKPLTAKVKTRPFAVFDLETTTDLEKCYLAGFYDGAYYHYFDFLNSDGSESESTPFFPEDPKGPVATFLTWLFSTDLYCKHWIYAHNGGNFDFLYLVRWLMANQSAYTFNVIPLQSSILCLEVIEKKRRQRQRKWTFLDSYRLMNASLEDIGKAFFGEGKVKNVNYENLHKDPRRYDYLRRDIDLLYNSIQKFSQIVHEAGGEIGMTAPSSAMKSFRRMHMNKWIPINRCFPGCDCEDKPRKKTF